MQLKSDKNLTSNALIGAAVLFLLPGIHQWTMTGLLFDVFDWMILGGCTFFLVMAIWARFAPLPPAAISLLVYLTFWTSLFGPIATKGEMPPMDWVLFGATSCLLLISLVGALRQPRGSRSPAS